MWYQKKKDSLKMNVETGIERCILCGKLTGICKDTPIGERKYYVEAAGQLCAGCYADLYAQPHNDDILWR